MTGTAELAGLLELQYRPSMLLGRAFPGGGDPWQIEAVDFLGRPRRGDEPARQAIAVTARQLGGKSTVGAAIATTRAVLEPDTDVVIVSAGQRTAAEVVSEVRRFLAHAVADPGDVEGEAMTSVRLSNGSRISALPATSVAMRGWSARVLVLDEGAYVSDEVAQAALPQLLATGGDLLLLGTPSGPTGFFYEAWEESQEASSPWRSWRVPVDACPRMDAGQVAALRRRMSPSRAARDLDAMFVEPEGSVISADALAAMFAAGAGDDDDGWRG